MRRIALLSTFVAAAVASAADVPERLAFSAPVTVDATGNVQVGDVEGVQGRLAEVVREELAGLPFVPARIEGQAADSTVLVDGEVVLVPKGDEFEVLIEGIASQPRLLAWRPADYTMALLRARETGSVALVLAVDADGRVTESRVVSGNTALADAAREATDDWRFQATDQGFEVGAAFWFHGNWEEARVPVIPCTVPAQLAHLPGEDGCIRTSETTGSVVARGRGDPHVRIELRTPAPPSAGGYRFEGP